MYYHVYHSFAFDPPARAARAQDSEADGWHLRGTVPSPAQGVRSAIAELLRPLFPPPAQFPPGLPAHPAAAAPPPATGPLPEPYGSLEAALLALPEPERQLVGPTRIVFARAPGPPLAHRDSNRPPI